METRLNKIMKNKNQHKIYNIPIKVKFYFVFAFSKETLV